jgi:hypothetical protein
MEQLTALEVRQCYHGIEFALKNFRESRAEGIVQVVMTEQQMKETEQMLLDLQEKLLRIYHEKGGD